MSLIRILHGEEPPVLGEKRPLLIGRDGSCDVVVKDTAASRRHARVEPSGDGWVLTDLGSANGTYLNGVRITSSVTLKGGDTFRVGREVYTVQAEEEATETAFVSVGDLRKNALGPATAAVAPLPATAVAPSTPSPAPERRAMPPAAATVGRNPRAFWLFLEGERHGPVSETDVAARLLRGELSLDDLAWTEGRADWEPLASFPELLPSASPGPPPLPRRR